ncbi:WG repeat-containing protein [Butyrivibrio sp. XB500-5]|uniref:WG repeat-containing protein n=1 Tax=Butyrivibrio sp. XB500-5 TaxID=2364880 RepID=UPI001313F12C|nr:WG repeat-containing protein [Butyrivibrio sp. XB500-5]
MPAVKNNQLVTGIFIAIFLMSFTIGGCSRENPKEVGYYIIDENLNIINPDTPFELEPGDFSKEGYTLGKGCNAQYMMNTKGEIISGPDDSYAGRNFGEDGYFKTGKGYYDKDFNLVVEIKYMDGDIAPSRIGDAPKSFSKNGLAAAQVLRAKKNGTGMDKVWGYIDNTGEFVIEPQYKEAEDFGDNGYALVENMDDTFEFIDENGDVVSEKYSNAYSFSDNGLAFVCELDTKRAGYVNDNFEYVIEGDYNSEEPFADNNLAVVTKKIDGKLRWGFINEKGEQVIDFQFSAAPYGFVNGYCVVGKDGKWGFIDETGNYIFEKKFSRQPNSFSEDGIALVQDDNGLYGYIKTDGTWLLEPQFEKATDFSNGYAGVWLNKKQKLKKQ